MDHIKHLEDVMEEISNLLTEIYSMGLISVNKNTLEGIERCKKLCNDCGLTYGKISLDKLHTGFSRSMSRLEKDYTDEAEEILLLGNWLILCEKELELEKAKKSLITGCNL